MTISPSYDLWEPFSSKQAPGILPHHLFKRVWRELINWLRCVRLQ